MYEKLKVKRKTLAAEARIIRLEEKKAKARRRTELLNSLNHHRTHYVRKSSRAAHLAYCFLKGTPYLAAENTYHEAPNIPEIEKNVRNFANLNLHPDMISQMVWDWFKRGIKPEFEKAVAE